MARHIALFVISPYPDNEPIKTYHDQSGLFEQNCKQTNETALRYFQWYLDKKYGQKLDCAFALAINDDKEKEGLERFKRLMKDIGVDLKTVDLAEHGSLQAAFASACQLVTELQAYISSKREKMKNVIVHIDMTGGPRHDVMLLMALVQMLKSYGLTIGKVMYGNLTNKLIEDVTPVMDMYTLTAGVEEFRQYASAKILLDYFSMDDWKRASKSLQKLISEMQLFSERIKLCVKFEDVKKQLKKLNEGLLLYENHIMSEISELDGNEEKLFAKLLKSIQDTYCVILNEQSAYSDTRKKIEIIRWCVMHGLIQQACTFYTEWLGSVIVGELKKGKNIWKSCSYGASASKLDKNTFFIRQYVPDQLRSQKPITYEDLLEFLKRSEMDCDYQSIQGRIKGKNERLEKCFEEVFRLQEENYGDKKIISYIHNLEDSNPLKIIVINAKVTKGQWEKYFEREYNSTNFAQLFFNCILSMDEDTLLDIFELRHKTEKSAEAILDIIKERKESFDFMFSNEDKNNKIELRVNKRGNKKGLTKDELIKIVSYYYVNVYYCHRNMMNHADYSVEETEQQTIGNLLLESLKVFDK